MLLLRLDGYGYAFNSPQARWVRVSHRSRRNSSPPVPPKARRASARKPPSRSGRGDFSFQNARFLAGEAKNRQATPVHAGFVGKESPKSAIDGPVRPTY